MLKRMGKWTWEKTAVSLLTVFLILAGCKSPGDTEEPIGVRSNNQEMKLVIQTAVPTATATPLPTHTPTAIPTQTPTPSPTATAMPITITGDPRSAILKKPEPQNNAICGTVDMLDFPLDPPDALTVHYGGRGFGRFRSRYDQYHAGEDWQLLRGRSNLGVPVYAIGHGRVVYAHPHGWGTDQGVIIIRHTFADGSTVLSFYGHMDPESVTLRNGDCIVRGQKIAEIGEPRTPPHLHFEIRTHMPDEPGPGYWPVDPTEAGWLPPSQFVWNNRMASMPGVLWTRPFTAEETRYIGTIKDKTLIILEDNHLLGLNVANGSLGWQHTMTNTVTHALLDSSRSLLYMITRRGQVAAYSLLETEEGTTALSEEPLWQLNLTTVGSPTLLPLPGGGLIVSVRQELTAVSADGDILWQAKSEQAPFDWLLTDEQLILSVADRQGLLYSATTDGLQTWQTPLSGHLIRADNQIWLHAHDGLYQLDPETMTAEQFYQLPQNFLDLGNIIALPDGGVMIAHQDRDDSRLIAFNSEGTVRWQRSYAQLGLGEIHLLSHDGEPYLLVQTGSDITTQVKLYAIDMQSSTLHHIFTGGTRTPSLNGNWIVSVHDNLLLINVGGGSMAMLDTETAVSLLDSSPN